MGKALPPSAGGACSIPGGGLRSSMPCGKKNKT